MHRNPEGPVDRVQARTRLRAVVDGELLAEGEFSEGLLVLAAEEGAEEVGDRLEVGHDRSHAIHLLDHGQCGQSRPPKAK